MRDAIFWGRIDKLDFVGGSNERFRHRFLHRFSANRLDLLLFLFDVLQIDRSDHVDAGREKLLDILPSLRVFASGRIMVSEPVDQHDFGMTADDGVDIDGRSLPGGWRSNNLKILKE